MKTKSLAAHVICLYMYHITALDWVKKQIERGKMKEKNNPEPINIDLVYVGNECYMTHINYDSVKGVEPNELQRMSGMPMMPQ